MNHIFNDRNPHDFPRHLEEAHLALREVWAVTLAKGGCCPEWTPSEHTWLFNKATMWGPVMWTLVYKAHEGFHIWVSSTIVTLEWCGPQFVAMSYSEGGPLCDGDPGAPKDLYVTYVQRMFGFSLIH